MRHALRLGEVLADETAEGDRAAAGHAGSKVRVGVGEEAARIVADDIETWNGIAVRVDRVHRRVDADAVHRAEDVARVFGAVEGCLRTAQPDGAVLCRSLRPCRFGRACCSARPWL